MSKRDRQLAEFERMERETAKRVARELSAIHKAAHKFDADYIDEALARESEKAGGDSIARVARPGHQRR